jgi:hypothetical protein
VDGEEIVTLNLRKEMIRAGEVEVVGGTLELLIMRLEQNRKHLPREGIAGEGTVDGIPGSPRIQMRV